jgi:hypothetical protein
LEFGFSIWLIELLQSGGDRQIQVGSSHGLLARVPGCDGLGFLLRERGENEVWVICLPRQCLGFIQGEVKQAFMRFTHFAEFGEDGVPDFLDLREELPAGCKTNVPRSWILSILIRDLIHHFHSPLHFQ